MKLNLKSILSALFICAFTGIAALQSAAAKAPTATSYFSKADAANWVYIIKDKKANAADVFKMENGTLQITGVSTGYLRTKKKFSDYTLNVEWRWTKSLGNSGVLVHIQPKDTVWPVCYQVQQKAKAAGDIICMNGLWAKECTDSVKFTVKKAQPSNEKPLGKWNSMKVICYKKTLKVYVNGVLQNNLTGLTATTGFIGFQNEGTALEFRNLSIIKQ